MIYFPYLDMSSGDLKICRNSCSAEASQSTVRKIWPIPTSPFNHHPPLPLTTTHRALLTMADAEAKFELITRRLQETLGGEAIKAILNEGKAPKCYWGEWKCLTQIILRVLTWLSGTAPTGRRMSMHIVSLVGHNVTNLFQSSHRIFRASHKDC